MNMFGYNRIIIPNKFRYEISKKKMQSFLSYLYEWEGLKFCAKIPSTYKDYEMKSRNWLNGKRSKKYSNTLYADMIQSVLSYAEKESIARFPGDNERDKKLQLIYHNMLINRCLLNMFSKRIQLNKTAKKSYLISEHTIKAKTTKTKDLLQKYCKNQSNSPSFPSHRREAIDHFQVICQ